MTLRVAYGVSNYAVVEKEEERVSRCRAFRLPSPTCSDCARAALPALPLKSLQVPGSRVFVMARGNILAAFSFEHARLASVCGIVSAAVTVALLVQMDRTTDCVGRQATISAVATFIGDIFAHPSHFPPQWAEPLITAAVSACIAVAVWHAKRWARGIGQRTEAVRSRP